MKRVFIGHRGVGKSSLLHRHKEYFPGVPAFDLDIEIELRTGKKVADIFANQGEPIFRELEHKVFQNIITLDNFVISVGGGFNPQFIPAECEVIFAKCRIIA